MCFAGSHIHNLISIAKTFDKLHPQAPYLAPIVTEDSYGTVGSVISHLDELSDEELVRVVRESADMVGLRAIDVD